VRFHAADPAKLLTKDEARRMAANSPSCRNRLRRDG